MSTKVLFCPSIILDWLKDNERSQAWLARKADISPEYLNRVLNGVYEPSDKMMRKINKVIK